MKILIIEDEPLVAKDLKNLVQSTMPEATVVAVLSSVESSRAWLEVNPRPDLILADIQLSDGISFEIFENVRIQCPIIFTTAYDNYAIRAFKLNSIDYLLKPVDRMDLQKAMEKYKAFKDSFAFETHIEKLLSQWGKPGQFKERFLVIHGNSMVPVSSDEIAYFCKDQLIYLYTRRNEKYISEFQSLDEIEELLDPAKFYRVNRQAIVHLEAVARLKTTQKGLSVFLKSPAEAEFDISREKATAFKKWLG